MLQHPDSLINNKQYQLFLKMLLFIYLLSSYRHPSITKQCLFFNEVFQALHYGIKVELILTEFVHRVGTSLVRP